MAGKCSSDGNSSRWSQSHLAYAEETRFARPCHAVTVCALLTTTRARAQPRIQWTRKHPLALWFPDMPIQMCWTFAETHQPLVAMPSLSFWPLVPARDEKSGFLLTADVQSAFLKGEFQDKDRVLYCKPPKNGPALPGVQLATLVLILKGVLGLSDAPRKWCQIGFRKASNVSWTVHAALSCRAC